LPKQLLTKTTRKQNQTYQNNSTAAKNPTHKILRINSTIQKSKQPTFPFGAACYASKKPEPEPFLVIVPRIHKTLHLQTEATLTTLTRIDGTQIF